MKPARFDYERPSALAGAFALLNRDNAFVKILAGGQSLGPMLNFRLVQPEMLVDVTRIPELNRIEDDADSVTLGACVTHAAIEDGRVPDPTGGVLPAVARGIAYRAVRTRGTIGGSLVHADPSADWLTCLAALDAELIIANAEGRRSVPVAGFMTGVFETNLGAGELVEAVRIPRRSKSARWGYYKVCRKPGEFAQAIGAVMVDPEVDLCRVVIGATESVPVVVADAEELFGVSDTGSLAQRFDGAAARRILESRGLGHDAYALHVHLVALARAVETVR
jgi:carbon-monoxide dehydrogenase medium subunit